MRGRDLRACMPPASERRFVGDPRRGVGGPCAPGTGDPLGEGFKGLADLDAVPDPAREPAALAVLGVRW